MGVCTCWPTLAHYARTAYVCALSRVTELPLRVVHRYVCPITLAVMDEPVEAEDGVNYEKASLGEPRPFPRVEP
jgi:hypothetical protein